MFLVFYTSEERMQVALSPCSWLTLKHSSHRHNCLVDSGTKFISPNLCDTNRKRRIEDYSSLQTKLRRRSNCFLLKHLVETRHGYYKSIQCNVGSQQHNLNTLKEGLKEEEQREWEGSREPLSMLNFSREEVDGIRGKAFGWVHSPYWGEVKEKIVPNNNLVSASLSYLRSIGLSDDDLHKLLKKFPEVLGCNIEDNLKNNVAILDKEWGIKGNTLRNLVLCNPKVLGYNVDCKGDCMAQCTRCWVRF